MITVFILLFGLCLWKIRFAGFHEDYAGWEQATAIKGIFAVFILCQHLTNYITLTATPGNSLFFHILHYIQQTMVAPFFFFSGYGICESVKHKDHYADTFPRKRILKLFVILEMAVLLQLAASTAIGVSYPLRNYFLCWIGWEEVGNCNWFLFAILLLYLASFLCMRLKKELMAIGILVLTIVVWLFLYYSKRPDFWWYDTLLAFPAGVFFSGVKEKFDNLFRRPLIWSIGAFLLALLYIGTHHLMGIDIWGVVSTIFCFLAVVITMKVKVGNPILRWLGQNALYIYLLQRIPFMILARFGLNQNLPVFIPISFALTFLLAEGFSRLTKVIWKY